MLADLPQARLQKRCVQAAIYSALALPLLLLGWLSPWVVPVHADRWVVECVDCPKYFADMSDRSLALDAAGRPHIAYGDDHLYYAWHDGLQWYYETVDASRGVGRYASLALDSKEYPHISYYDDEEESVKYAYQDASGWHLETVQNETRAWHTSLALDDDNRSHIAYGVILGFPRYAYRDAEGWQVQVIDQEPYVDGVALALDAAGRPHVVYYGELPDLSDELRYAYLDQETWHISTIDDPSYTGGHFSFVLDGDGYPHVAYSHDGYPLNPLRYAYADATGWHRTVVEALEEDWPSNPSLALDNLGRPHISYGVYNSAGPVQELRYAYQCPPGWCISMLDAGGGTYTSLALDGNTRPHITYASANDLKYVWQDASSGWHTELVDRGRAVSYDVSLALDATGLPHASYSASEGRVDYAYKDVSGWQFEAVSNGPEVRFGSLALAQDGYPRLSFAYGQQPGEHHLAYASRGNDGWQIEIVDDQDSYVPRAGSLALDQDGYAHIGYAGQFRLLYAYLDSTGWYTETVYQGNVHDDDISLKLSASEQARIAYSVYSTKELRYAYRDGSGWHDELVASNLGVLYGGGNPSLALDTGGYPHISFNTPDMLKYAYQDASGWHIETVDDAGSFPGETSLALDAAGRPHIGYFAQEGNSLKHAYKDALGWHVETVPGGGGYYVSLAIDAADRVHIAYIDSLTHDLKYAFSFEVHHTLYLPLAVKSSAAGVNR